MFLFGRDFLEEGCRAFTGGKPTKKGFELIAAPLVNITSPPIGRRFCRAVIHYRRVSLQIMVVGTGEALVDIIV